VNSAKASIVVGKIVGVAGRFVLPDGSTGYTTASVSYSIEFTSDGGGVVPLTGQTPEIRLWGPNQVLDAEYLIGSSCIGVVIGGELRWHFVEPPSLASCGPAPTPGGNGVITDPIIRGAVRRGVPLPPIDGTPTDSAVGGGTGATGTGEGGDIT
jgi:hypothetical protein